MSYYDYGPLRFSVMRGLLLTFVVPIVAAVGLGAFYFMFVTHEPLPEAVASAAHDIGDYYRHYPQWALLMHAIFFVRGFAYRRRYYSRAPSILVLVAIGIFIWGAASRHDARTASLVSSLSSTVRGLAPDEPDRAPDNASSPAHATPADVNPLALHVDRPNRLQQERSRVPEVARAAPDVEGRWLFVGYLGPASVVYVLNQASAISVAPASLRPSATSAPCPPYTSKMDGQPVSGCLAWVDELYVGPVPLPRLQVFFTTQLPADWPSNYVLLGGNATKQVDVARSSAGVVTIRSKAASAASPAF